MTFPVALQTVPVRICTVRFISVLFKIIIRNIFILRFVVFTPFGFILVFFGYIIRIFFVEIIFLLMSVPSEGKECFQTAVFLFRCFRRFRNIFIRFLGRILLIRRDRFPDFLI